MSQPSGVRGFTITLYGQSGVVMDWFGLTDPFTQQLPLKINNTYSGTLWFQGAVVNPRSGYYSFSGIQMGAVNSGASNTLVMTWDAGVSGWIATSSPITDSLTLNIATYTSSNYTGIYDSGTVTIPNTLFNRYSGVIKVFGDIYSNDQPTPTLSQGGTGTLPTSQTYSYAISYIQSGWESDIGSATNLSNNSGALAVSWSLITGVSQYYVWRWSGTVDYTLYSGNNPGAGFLRPMDLMTVTTTNSFTDNGTAPLQTNYFRHRNWERMSGTHTLPNSDAATYLDGPASRQFGGGASFTHCHGYGLNKNTSGTSLLGPFYMVLHSRASAATNFAFAISSNTDGFMSGTAIGDFNALTNQLANVWYRNTFMMGSSGSLSASGTIHVQVFQGTNSPTINIDSAFIVAQS